MVKEDRSKNLLSHKSLLILIKYIPHIIAIAYAIYTFLGIFGIDYNVFGCFFHVSFLTWIILYCLSIVFKYCYVHRLPIYYIGANELITCLDYYLDIELDYFTFITISLLMSCTLIFGYTYYYINKLKMRDKKKFYVPKHIKNPLPGDYEVTLNWGDKVYVEKNEFEKKTSKFFKNYLVVEDNLEDNHDYSQDYFTIVSLEDNNEIKWIINSYAPVSTVAKNISISTDNGLTWTEYSPSNTVIATLNTNDKLLVKGLNTTYAGNGYINRIYSSKHYNVEGNIMSLLYGDNYKEQTTMITENSPFNGFFGTDNIISAGNLILPATTLTEKCYSSMFLDCTSLTTAPKLPATILANNCYSSMFQGCTNLITAPELPATTLAMNCYTGMFYDCTSLTTAPKLPATTLANYCYANMFSGCTSLTTAPELPAITLETGCYFTMFSGCTNLNYIKAMFITIISDISYTNSWVVNVASNGTFVKNSAATWNVTGNNGVPNGWTVIEA